MNRNFYAGRLLLLLASLSLIACDPGQPSAPPVVPPEPSVTPEPAEPTVPVPTPQTSSNEAELTGPSSTPEQNAAPDQQVAARSSEFLPAAEREAYDLDYQVTGADGQLMKLSDLVGHPMAVTFFYTRCPVADMCPMVVASMRQLHRLTREAGIDEKVRLVMLTMDPYHDTPVRLESYSREHGLTGSNLVLLRPEPDKLRQLFHEFGFVATFNEDFTIDHPLDLYLVDAKGQFVRYYTGSLWDNAKVLEDLKTLTAE